MRVHFVVHEPFEAPGVYESWARERGHEITRSLLYVGEPLPGDARAVDLLVIMGGPQSPATTTAECPYFDARAEMALIAACVAAGTAVIGVCLGSQLLGEALGAPCERSSEEEVGLFPVTLTQAGRRHPFFEDFETEFGAGHWHKDMPGLTDEAVVLARSKGCARQIVAYGRFLYGLQCHMEFTPALVDALIKSAGDELSSLSGRRFVQQPPALRQNDYGPMNKKLIAFLDRLAADYSAVARG
ncbi:GMP synthase [Streptomyces dioscori]|uniref:GMP synthase n=1 Tax=Streptomyces dioscori TaxID=2109333 RepID=A0A2P8Q9M0_9ACTN|nr:glutamine amidotransferase [Streptomyces dioscori]PSM42951.1 GMP synthase [Streptomyces dioscori]